MTDHAAIVRDNLRLGLGGKIREDALAALDALVAERDEARREVEFHKERRLQEVDIEVKAREAAEARAATLETALRFYAAASTYIEGSEPHPIHRATGIVPIERDGGAIARAALAANTTAKEPA